MTQVNKIDSNSTGLRIAEEKSLGVLDPTPANQFWFPYEPNSYSDFGGQIKTVARNPINASRQNQKGVTVDLDASGGFNSDVTQTNMLRPLQGFFFADIREPFATKYLNAAANNAVSAVDADTKTYTLTNNDTKHPILGSILLAAGFNTPANNGLLHVASSTNNTVVVSETVADETPPATATLEQVGYQFASDTLDVDISGNLPKLMRASGTVDFTTLGLIPGQFIYIGGDAADTAFANAENNGWARIHSITASYIELDKTTDTMVAETGTDLTVEIYFGKVLKNESNKTLIKRRSFQIERDLGQKDDAVPAHQGEYLVGAIANEYTLNVKQADKLNADLTFVATDHQTRTQADGLKSDVAGVNSPALVSEDAFNTSSHVARLRMTVLDPTDANPSPLFGYLTEFTVVVNNNVQPNKAVSVLGAFDLTAGQFDVSGKVTAYFSDVEAVAAVRQNKDVSLDFIFANDNKGFAYDVPLTSLGDGRLSVEQDNPITLPLDVNAAADRTFNHTLLVESFSYLPDVAMPE